MNVEGIVYCPNCEEPLVRDKEGYYCGKCGIELDELDVRILILQQLREGVI